MYRDKGIRYKDKRLTVQVKDRYTDIGYKDARMQETGCTRQETGDRRQDAGCKRKSSGLSEVGRTVIPR